MKQITTGVNALDKRIQTYAGVRVIGSVFLTKHLKEVLKEMQCQIETTQE